MRSTAPDITGKTSAAPIAVSSGPTPSDEVQQSQQSVTSTLPVSRAPSPVASIASTSASFFSASSSSVSGVGAGNNVADSLLSALDPSRAARFYRLLTSDRAAVDTSPYALSKGATQNATEASVEEEEEVFFVHRAENHRGKKRQRASGISLLPSESPPQPQASDQIDQLPYPCTSSSLAAARLADLRNYVESVPTSSVSAASSSGQTLCRPVFQLSTPRGSPLLQHLEELDSARQNLNSSEQASGHAREQPPNSPIHGDSATKTATRVSVTWKDMPPDSSEQDVRSSPALSAASSDDERPERLVLSRSKSADPAEQRDQHGHSDSNGNNELVSEPEYDARAQLPLVHDPIHTRRSLYEKWIENGTAHQLQDPEDQSDKESDLNLSYSRVGVKPMTAHDFLPILVEEALGSVQSRGPLNSRGDNIDRKATADSSPQRVKNDPLGKPFDNLTLATQSREDIFATLAKDSLAFQTLSASVRTTRLPADSGSNGAPFYDPRTSTNTRAILSWALGTNTAGTAASIEANVRRWQRLNRSKNHGAESQGALSSPEPSVFSVKEESSTNAHVPTKDHLQPTEFRERRQESSYYIGSSNQAPESLTHHSTGQSPSLSSRSNRLFRSQHFATGAAASHTGASTSSESQVSDGETQRLGKELLDKSEGLLSLDVFAQQQGRSEATNALPTQGTDSPDPQNTCTPSPLEKGRGARYGPSSPAPFSDPHEVLKLLDIADNLRSEKQKLHDLQDAAARAQEAARFAENSDPDQSEVSTPAPSPRRDSLSLPSPQGSLYQHGTHRRGLSRQDILTLSRMNSDIDSSKTPRKFSHSRQPSFRRELDVNPETSIQNDISEARNYFHSRLQTKPKVSDISGEASQTPSTEETNLAQRPSQPGQDSIGSLSASSAAIPVYFSTLTPSNSRSRLVERAPPDGKRSQEASTTTAENLPRTRDSGVMRGAESRHPPADFGTSLRLFSPSSAHSTGTPRVGSLSVSLISYASSERISELRNKEMEEPDRLSKSEISKEEVYLHSRLNGRVKLTPHRERKSTPAASTALVTTLSRAKAIPAPLVLSGKNALLSLSASKRNLTECAQEMPTQQPQQVERARSGLAVPRSTFQGPFTQSKEHSTLANVGDIPQPRRIRATVESLAKLGAQGMDPFQVLSGSTR